MSGQIVDDIKIVLFTGKMIDNSSKSKYDRIYRSMGPENISLVH